MKVASNSSLEGSLISVVMPCYNAAAYLSEAIDSAMHQTHASVELILVDDGSTDGSQGIAAERAQRYNGRITLLHTRRCGPYPARNAGLARVRGEFVAFLDADDWWEPSALEKLLRTLALSGADIAYCGWQNVGTDIRSAPHIPPEYEKEDPVTHFLRSCPWPIHAALVRRSLLDRLGGFSERRYSSMDYDFWLRALAISRWLARVPEVLAYYRWHGASQVSAVKWRQVLDALVAQQDFIRANPRLVSHISPSVIKDLTAGQVMRQAYRALWRRDLVSSQKLFRYMASVGEFGIKDLVYLLAAATPMPVYRWLATRAREPSRE